MNCFLCDNSFSEIKTKNILKQYCHNCNFHKTIHTNKEKESYKSEFWDESDYSEFAGTDFTDKGVQDLVLTFESWYSYFKPFIKNRKNILDIGSGTGISCILLEKKGYNIIGVDPDPRNAKLINSKLKKGKCINSFFENLELEEKVDVIWITHVIEHLDQPDVLLKKCKEWLNPDGIICIAVPDCENPEMLKNSLTNPYHIFHFSKNSLNQLFQKTKFEIKICDSLSNLQKTNRRTHKILRKFGFSNLSMRIKPFYPFELTSKNNGYEIRCVIKFK